MMDDLEILLERSAYRARSEKEAREREAQDHYRRIELLNFATNELATIYFTDDKFCWDAFAKPRQPIPDAYYEERASLTVQFMKMLRENHRGGRILEFDPEHDLAAKAARKVYVLADCGDAAGVAKLFKLLQEQVENSLKEKAERWIRRDLPCYLIDGAAAITSNATSPPGSPEPILIEQSDDAPVLNDCELAVLQTLDEAKANADKGLTAERIATKSGYEFNSHLRSTLSAMKKRGLIGNTRGKGYFRMS